MLLGDQDIVLQPVPSAGPVFVRPHQQEGEVHFLVCQKTIDWHFHQTFTSKPVMVVGKPIQTILFCQFDLPEMNVLNTKVIKTEFTGQVGLVVTAELGDCPGYISPFRKTFPPPFIVFRKRMVLR